MNNQQPAKDLKAAIADRITAEKIKPYARTYWLLVEYLIWLLWGLTVLIGALAVAVLLFASVQMSFELHEVTYSSTWDYIFDLLPFLWIFVLALMSVLAYYNLRHTKHGYKYSLSMIIMSSIGCSIVGGFIFHFIGVGYYVDTYLGQVAPIYRSQAVVGAKQWQDPVHGRLLGQLREMEEIEESIVLFEDNHGTEWQLIVSELRPRDLELLKTGDAVRLLGVVATDTPSTIYGCGVFPWLLNKPPALHDLKEQRQMFVERMGLNKDQMLGEREKPDEETAEFTQNFCRHRLEPVR